LIKTEEKEIDGLRFSVTQLPGMRGLRMSVRLGKLLGPALARAAGAATGGLASLDVSKLSGAVDALFEHLTEDEIESVTKALLESCLVTIEGKTGPLMPMFDTVMGGKVATVYKLLRFAFEVNFGNFFGGLAALGAQFGAGPESRPLQQ